MESGIVWGAVIAGAVAAAELLARYRDDPLRALLSIPAIGYVLLNAGTAALAGSWIVHTVVTGPLATLKSDPFQFALFAGVGSLALLRTSVMKLKTDGGSDISIGPAVVIEQLLSVVDRSIDRLLASRRSLIAADLADKLDFDTHNAELVALCITLLQNPSPTEEAKLTAVSRALAGRLDMSARVKSISLVLALLSVVGRNVLEEAVKTLEKPAPATKA